MSVFRFLSLYCGLTLLPLACSQPERDANPEWSAYELAATQCAGSWRLAPVLNERESHEPPCIDELAIDVHLPTLPPEGFALRTPRGSCTVTLCGQPIEASIKAVTVGTRIAPGLPGTAQPPKPLGKQYEFACLSREAPALYLSFSYAPSSLFTDGNESLLVMFHELDGRLTDDWLPSLQSGQQFRFIR